MLSMDYQSYKPTLRCHQCSMVFNSIDQLSKHRDKFCVGTNNHLIYDPYYATPKAEIAEEKIRQLQALKEASARRSNENHLREKFLLNQSRLRTGPTEVDHQLQRRVNKLSHKHDRQLTDLKSKTASLQQSRSVIESKIAALKRGFDRGNERADFQDDSYLSAIDDLRTQIKALRNNQPHVPSSSHPSLPTQHTFTVLPRQHSPIVVPNQQSATPQPSVRQTPANIAFNFSGGSLVAEISALRQHYIQTGGRDPAALTQLTEMLKDAEQLEAANRLPLTSKRQPHYNTDNHQSEELVAMELENNRLQRELLRLQNATGATHLPLSDGLNTNAHVDRMLALEREMELAKHQALLDAMRNEKRTPDPLHPYYKRIDNIPTKGYNPNQGFVCFYDFVMGLESSARICRLIVGLYDKIAELGEPSMLPTVYTELSPGGTTAMLGARQPVPHCPASNDMYLVVELQTSDSTPEELRTKAWLKLDVFNLNLALQTGAWKLPFHKLPIKLDMSSAELSSYPPHGDAMLYMRVVHQRDSLVQSEATISAANYIDYQYPTISRRPSIAPPPTNEQTRYSWAS